MRSSELLIATLKETPADAEVISHQLMLRAGLIRKLASGLYTWLPMGLRVLRKIEAIVRDEMNNAGAQEVLMPVVQPAELWEASGRWEQYGAELLRIDDREHSAAHGAANGVHGYGAGAVHALWAANLLGSTGVVPSQ